MSRRHSILDGESEAKSTRKPGTSGALDLTMLLLGDRINIPYQSIFEPDGRHAYNPAERQYPQSGWADRQNWRRAESLADRANAWAQVRPSQLTHPLGVSMSMHVYGVANADSDPTRLLYPVVAEGNNIPVRMTSSRPPDPRFYPAQPSPWDAYRGASEEMQGPEGGYGGFG